MVAKHTRVFVSVGFIKRDPRFSSLLRSLLLQEGSTSYQRLLLFIRLIDYSFWDPFS
jgi:hypothetical protein